MVMGVSLYMMRVSYAFGVVRMDKAAAKIKYGFEPLKS
jgi:hypothetical protein